MRARDKVLINAALVVAVAGFTAKLVFSEDTKVAVSKDELEKRFAEMGRRVEQHIALAADAGTWDSEVMRTDESGEVKSSKAVSTVTPVLNGLYVTEQFKSDMDGKPFEGFEIRGYSKEKGKYFGIWCDSMSSTPEITWGTADSTGKVITFDGEARVCPMGEYTPRWVLRHVDADHQIFEHWSKFTSSPDYKKMLEVRYTRRK